MVNYRWSNSNKPWCFLLFRCLYLPGYSHLLDACQFWEILKSTIWEKVWSSLWKLRAWQQICHTISFHLPHAEDEPVSHLHVFNNFHLSGANIFRSTDHCNQCNGIEFLFNKREACSRVTQWDRNYADRLSCNYLFIICSRYPNKRWNRFLLSNYHVDTFYCKYWESIISWNPSNSQSLKKKIHDQRSLEKT